MPRQPLLLARRGWSRFTGLLGSGRRRMACHGQLQQLNAHKQQGPVAGSLVHPVSCAMVPGPPAHLSSSSIRAPARLAPARTSVPLPSSSTWRLVWTDEVGGEHSQRNVCMASKVLAQRKACRQCVQRAVRGQVEAGHGPGSQPQLLQPHQDERALGHILQHVPAASAGQTGWIGLRGRSIAVERACSARRGPAA